VAEDLASANVTRSYSLTATSIAIFTFMLFFMYPRFRSGEINPLMFQATLIVMAVAIFSLVFASLHYYTASAGHWGDDVERARWRRRGDSFWLLGYTLLFLDPSLILFSIRLPVVAGTWFALWLVYLVFMLRILPGLRAGRH